MGSGFMEASSDGLTSFGENIEDSLLFYSCISVWPMRLKAAET